MSRWIAVSLFAVIACGGGQAASPTKPPVVAEGSAAAGSAEAGSADAGDGTETLSSASGDGLAAAGTAAAYMHAVTQRDWPGACATRTQGDRQRLAKLGGSCERGVEKWVASQATGGYATATTGAIRRRGGTIAVDIVQAGEAKPTATLFLRREDGLWHLVDEPEGGAF